MDSIDFEKCMCEGNFIDEDTIKKSIITKRCTMDMLMKLNLILSTNLPNIKFSDFSNNEKPMSYEYRINGSKYPYILNCVDLDSDDGFVSFNGKYDTFIMYLDSIPENVEQMFLKFLYRNEYPIVY